MSAALRPAEAVRGTIRNAFTRSRAAVASLPPPPLPPPEGAGLATLLRAAVSAPSDIFADLVPIHTQLLRDLSRAGQQIDNWRGRSSALASVALHLDGKGPVAPHADGAVRMAAAIVVGSADAPQLAGQLRDELQRAERSIIQAQIELIRARSAAATALAAWRADRAAEARHPDAAKLAAAHTAATAEHRALLKKCDSDPAGVLRAAAEQYGGGA